MGDGNRRILFDFYPRSPCGERRRRGANRWRAQNFYPRSPCGERRKNSGTISIAFQFLSTLSLRRATGSVRGISSGSAISIHALLAESDFREQFKYVVQCRNFYPRSPCGERPSRTENEGPSFCISIHALLAESDCLIHSKHS